MKPFKTQSICNEKWRCPDCALAFMTFLIRFAVIAVVFFMTCARIEGADVVTDYATAKRQILSLEKEGRITEAVGLAQQLQVILEQRGPGSETELRECLLMLGKLLFANQRFTEAEKSLRDSLRLCLNSVGEDDAATAHAMHELALVLFDLGKIREAGELEGKALQTCLRKFPGASEATTSILRHLAQIEASKGHYKDALKHAIEAREMCVVVFQEMHPNTASCFMTEATIRSNMADYRGSEECFNKALKIRQEKLAPFDEGVGSTYLSLFELYLSENRYDKAEEVLTKAEQIAAKQKADHRMLGARVALQKGLLLSARGYYTKALAEFESAKKIGIESLGKNSPFVIQVWEREGSVYDRQGKYGKAETCYSTAISLYRVTYGEQSPAPTRALRARGSMYQRIGDYVKAREALEKAESLARASFGADSPSTASCLSSLGSLEDAVGNASKAIKLFRDALSGIEKTLGKEHGEYAAVLSMMGGLERRQGEFQNALPRFVEAARIYKNLVGVRHVNYAAALRDIALTQHGAGNLAAAEIQYQEALDVMETAVGPKHIFTSEILNSFAWLKIELGKSEDATSLAKRAAEGDEDVLQGILEFAPEEQRLAFVQKQENPYSLFAALNSPTDLARVVLRRKLAILDSIQEERSLLKRASNDPDLKRKAAERVAIQHQLFQREMEPTVLPTSAAANGRIQTATIRAQLQEVQSQLARNFASLGRTRRALVASPQTVQHALPEGSALIEYFRFRISLGSGKWKSCYGAVVLTRNGSPQWCRLGTNEDGSLISDAEAIESRISLLLRELRKSGDDAPIEKDVIDGLEALYSAVWAPVARILKKNVQSEISTIIVSPDAALNLISFATLLEETKGDDGKSKLAFLADKYLIRYVSTGRDLVTKAEESANNAPNPAVLVVSPEFSKIASAGERQQPVTGQLPRFRPILLSDVAVQELRRTLELKMRCAPPLIGRDATEANVTAIHSPNILHLFTHGFFLPTPSTKYSIGSDDTTFEPARRDLSGVLADPMRRSGIALVGANDAFTQWETPVQHETADLINPADDGVLTAEEVAEMDLQNTWLVTLGACDTGTGDLAVGEGVMGLRRAFALTGAQNVLMTLWPVSETYTPQFLLQFYRSALDSGDPSTALAVLQRKELRDGLENEGVSAAVKKSGPFVINSQHLPK